jgi:NAD/NADP transhydrogenase alpha subunit
MRNYDLSKAFRRPELAERLKKNGYTVQITSGEGDKKRVVDEYFVSPEEVQAYDLLRETRRISSQNKNSLSE